jgi:hypothetical protein
MKACIHVCPVVPTSTDRISDPLPTRLLLGIVDGDKIGLNQQISDVIVLPNRKISCSFERLLSMRDPMSDVYGAGAIKFASSIEGEIVSDYSSASPLEAAYYWSISSRAAFDKGLEFHKSIFKIDCEDLVPDQLFPGDNSSVYL